ncbi:MAG: hypothetical protein K2X28_07155 [Alphaproteobacteria bacterium]|nr:hypothetical protein [Alphaproteobacteria bacterium]
MNILKKLKLVLLIIGAMLSSYDVYAMEKTEEKKPVSGAKLSSGGQIVPSSKPIGFDKARLLIVHKFPAAADFSKKLAVMNSDGKDT